MMATLLAAWRAFAPYGLLVVVAVLWLYVALRWISKKERQLTPQARGELTRRFPRLIGAFDILYTLRKHGLDSKLLERGVRTVAEGGRAPAIVAAIDALNNDPDVDGITLTHGESLVSKGYQLTSMAPLELPPATVYPPPTAELAARIGPSEPYVLVRSDRPPPANDERSTKLMVLSEIVLGLMLALHGTDNTPERLAPVANAIAQEAEAAPLWDAPDGAERTALMLVAVAQHESSLRERVRRCEVRGDGGRSIGLFQLMGRFAWHTHSVQEICESDDLQARLALRMLHLHRGHGVSDPAALMRAYASGSAGRDSHQARELMATYKSLRVRAEAAAP